MSIITVTNLSAFYESRKVFENLNFSVKEGDYLCIIGENGTGKTTLMKLLLGLDVKHSGKIAFEGFTKKEIGWLPQKTAHQSDFPASVNEVVMSGFAGRKFLGLFYSKELKKQAVKNMQILGIADIAEASFAELSGGQQQKVLLCRALCAAKRVLLLDEPASSLDVAAADELYSLIKKLNDNGLAIIMITHDIDRAKCQAKSILSLSHDGYFFGNAEEYEREVK